MATFDVKAFMRTKYQSRIVEVPVPDLRDFFAEGADPVWKVRGLTGQELGRANEAVEKNRTVAAIVKGLAGQSEKEKIQAIQSLLGTGSGAPDDVAKRIELLTMGSVDPPCSQDLAVKLCEVFPVEFYQLTTKILELTGKGHEPGKSKPSGSDGTSRQASPSATPEGDSSTRPDQTSSRKGSSLKRK